MHCTVRARIGPGQLRSWPSLEATRKRTQWVHRHVVLSKCTSITRAEQKQPEQKQPHTRKEGLDAQIVAPRGLNSSNSTHASQDRARKEYVLAVTRMPNIRGRMWEGHRHQSTRL